MELETSDGRIAALERMLLIREFETRVSRLFADNLLPGFVHLYIGEEAVAVGVCSALDPEDQIFSTHRGHGHALAKGLDPVACLSELYGKSNGICGGKGGSLHLADVDKGMMGANGLVGSNASLAAGAALTSQVKDSGRVAVSFIGDGAYASGQIHESLNLAATWDLPVVYVIENNRYSAFTPLDKQVNVDNLSDLAKAYDIPGKTIDGQDVTTVNQTAGEAIDRARSGGGPTLIEAETYRYRGHHEGDTDHQGGYRSLDEVEEWEGNDPIENFKEKLMNAGTITDGEFDELDTRVTETIDHAVEVAEEATYPEPSRAYADVFSETPPEIDQFLKQVEAQGGRSQ